MLQLAEFSRFGNLSIDVAAPGVRILSTSIGGGFAHMKGAAMTTPHAAEPLSLAAGTVSSFGFCNAALSNKENANEGRVARR